MAALTAQLKQKDDVIQKYEEMAREEEAKKGAAELAQSNSSDRSDGDANPPAMDPYLGNDRTNGAIQGSVGYEDDRKRDELFASDSTSSMTPAPGAVTAGQRRNLMKDLFTPLRSMFERDKADGPQPPIAVTAPPSAQVTGDGKGDLERGRHSGLKGRGSGQNRDRSSTTMSLLTNPPLSSHLTPAPSAGQTKPGSHIHPGSAVPSKPPQSGRVRSPSSPPPNPGSFLNFRRPISASASSASSSSTSSSHSPSLVRHGIPIVSPDMEKDIFVTPWKCSTCLHLNTQGNYCELCTEPAPVTAGSSDEDDLSDRLILLSKRKHESFDENAGLGFGRREGRESRGAEEWEKRREREGEEGEEEEEICVRRTRSDVLGGIGVIEEGGGEGRRGNVPLGPNGGSEVLRERERESESVVQVSEGPRSLSLSLPLSYSEGEVAVGERKTDEREEREREEREEREREEREKVLERLRRIRELLRSVAEEAERE